MSRPPLVSIGLPVRNGARYLSEAIQSVLNQSLSDFELIIADNASFDETESICRGFAERDPRISYHRQPRDLGAAPNFHFTLRVSSGRYFKWLAHDDVLEPGFLSAGVAALRETPAAGVCYCALTMIDETGAAIEVRENRLLGAEHDDPARRFHTMALTSHDCFAVFGLIRRERLAAAAPMGSYANADRALLAELALQAPFVYLASPMIRIRLHKARYSSREQLDPKAAITWWATANAGQRPMHHWQLLRGYLAAIRNHAPGWRARLRCYGHLARWPWVNWHGIWLLLEASGFADTSVMTAGRALKRRIFGAV